MAEGAEAHNSMAPILEHSASHKFGGASAFPTLKGELFQGRRKKGVIGAPLEKVAEDETMESIGKSTVVGVSADLGTTMLELRPDTPHHDKIEAVSRIFEFLSAGGFVSSSPSHAYNLYPFPSGRLELGI